MMAIFSALPGDTVWYLDNRFSQDIKWSFCESVPVTTDIDEEEEEALYDITSVHKEIIALFYFYKKKTLYKETMFIAFAPVHLTCKGVWDQLMRKRHHCGRKMVKSVRDGRKSKGFITINGPMSLTLLVNCSVSIFV